MVDVAKAALVTLFAAASRDEVNASQIWSMDRGLAVLLVVVGSRSACCFWTSACCFWTCFWTCLLLVVFGLVAVTVFNPFLILALVVVVQHHQHPIVGE